LWNIQTKEEIRSRDEICLETDDPVGLPLPDLSLLDMQWILHRVTALRGAAESSDDFDEDDDDDGYMALGNEEDLETEDEWSAYTPSPAKASPPSSPPPPFPLFFPSAAAKEVEFATTTTADESIVSGTGEAINPEAEVKKDTPKDEAKGKRTADLDAVAKFEEREAKKRMVGQN